MKFEELSLEKVVIEIRFNKGFRYLDNRGKVINELIESDPQLVLESVSEQGARLIHGGKRALAIVFSSTQANIVEEFPKSLVEFGVFADKAFEILNRNFGIDAYIRTGNRFIHVLPLKDNSEGVKFLEDWNFPVFSSKEASFFGKDLATTNSFSEMRIENEHVGRSFRIGIINRNFIMDVPAFMKVAPMNVPSPASIILNLDVDVYTKRVVEIGSFKASEFIKSNHRMIEENLLPFLESRKK